MSAKSAALSSTARMIPPVSVAGVGVFIGTAQIYLNFDTEAPLSAFHLSKEL
jgi:hypothetical protein